MKPIDKKNIDDQKNLCFLNLNSSVYRVFVRLYAMYPCNFLNYLKKIYGLNCNSENKAVFHQIIEPMLSKIRFHPLLITATKDKECDKSRWFYKEPHDILDECGQYSIDPKESLCFDDNFSKFYDFLINNEDSMIEDNLYRNTFSEDSNAIFSQLFREMNEKEKACQISPLSEITNSKKSQDSKIINLDPAQEALMLSKDVTGKIQHSNDEITTKNLVKPVAISANAEITHIPMQKKTINNKKQLCFSPFKPIKELDNNVTGNCVQEYPTINFSPVGNQVFENQSNNTVADQFNVNNENEEVDMEIISYNLENKLVKNDIQTKEDKNDFTLIKENEIRNANDEFKANIDEDNVNVDKDKDKIENDLTISEELINKVKTSFKQVNKRIRYQSNCLPETGHDDSDFYTNGLSISLSKLNSFSKSCPMLYFKNDDDTFEIIKENESTNIDPNDNNKKEAKKRILKECPTAKSSNLILENPNAELKHNTNTGVNKTCKSVDFSKEIKYQLFSNDNPRNIYFKLLMDPRRHLFQSSTSIDSQKFEISSPHDLLDRTLLTLSDVYLKDLNERQAEHDESNQTSRRDSVLNTNSSASSIEHIPSLNYLNSNSSEEDMRKILAIMYAQLVFERHQRDLHMVRNRRLYKKFKECIQLEEKYQTLQEQMKYKIKENDHLRNLLKKYALQMDNERTMFMNENVKLEENVLKLKTNYELLQNEKLEQELHYKQEIAGLNKNFRTKELELNKYLCDFKNVDIGKLERENQELKHQIFLFGEFCGKISDVYSQSKCIPEINDKLIFESLKTENEGIFLR